MGKILKHGTIHHWQRENERNVLLRCYWGCSLALLFFQSNLAMCTKSLNNIPPWQLGDFASGKLAKENNHAYRKESDKDVYYTIMHTLTLHVTNSLNV